MEVLHYLATGHILGFILSKMIICHGDILVTACEDIKIPCQHRAIAYMECGQWWVFQNTPSKFNTYGGNIVSTPLDEFLAQRKLHRVINANLDLDCVRQYNSDNRERKWHVLEFNCEDYVNEVASGNRYSQLRRNYLAVGALGALLLWA